MIQILAVILLSSASVADDISIFVDDTHEHAWINIYETDERHMQLDSNYSGNGTVDARLFPVALVRVTSASPRSSEKPVRISISRDAKIAIDCANSTSITIELQAWNRDKREYEILTSPVAEFQPLRSENADLLKPLFQHVCGPEWRYTPQQ